MSKKVLAWIFVCLIAVGVIYLVFVRPKNIPGNINTQAAAVLSDADKQILLQQLNAQVTAYQKAIDDLRAQLADIQNSPITDALAPTVSITNPIDGAIVSGTITLTATASDNVGVTKVELYSGTQLAKTFTSPPYTISEDSKLYPDGAYTITAKAYDAAGNSKTSNAVSITIKNSQDAATCSAPLTETRTLDCPTGQIGSITQSRTKGPAPSCAPGEWIQIKSTCAPDVAASTKFHTNDRVQVQTGTFLNIHSSASASSITVTGTQLNNLLGTVVGGPTYASGFHWWNINFDSGVDGWAAEDFLVKYTVTTPAVDAIAPTVSITSPTNGQTVSGTSTTSVSASDNVGVTKVEFFLNGVLSAEDTTFPYSVSGDTTSLPDSTYTITAKAYDAAGNSKTSGDVKITVKNNSTTTNPSPTVSVSVSPSLITSGQSATITWNSTNTTACTATGGWAGAKAVSGNQSVSPTANTTYTLSCAGAGGSSSSDSFTITVGTTATSGSMPPITMPNEPSGMTKISESSFNCVDNCAGTWSSWDKQYAASIVVDSTDPTPKGDNRASQMNFDSRTPPGNSPGSLAITDASFTRKQDLYVATWIKLSDDYFGNESGVNKVLHFFTHPGSKLDLNGDGQTDGGNEVIFNFRGAGAETIVPGILLQGLRAPYTFTQLYGSLATYTSTEQNLDPAPSTCTVKRGQWYRYEIYLHNNTPGSADGSVKLWQNDKLCISQSGITFVAPSEENKWNQIWYSPTWGGGGAPITGNFEEWMDHIYVSGK